METKYIIIGIAVVAVVVFLMLKGGSSVSDSPPEGTTDDDIRNLAQQGRKIQAIKWYRATHGVGLKEAKEAVEKMM